MAIQVYWQDDSKTIIRYDFDEVWNWNEFWQAFEQGYALGAQVTHRIDIIADLSKSNIVPQNALLHIKKISEHQHPHAALSIIVTPIRVMHALYKISATIYPRVQYHFRICHTPEEAEALIKQNRSEPAELCH